MLKRELLHIGGIALLVAAMLLSPRKLVAQNNDTQFAERIDTFLAGQNTTKKPLAGMGSDFVKSGREFNVDPRLIVAISGAESSFGSRICTPYNAWNWFWNSWCQSPFDSWSSGANTVSKYMHKSYIIKGYNTIPLIGARYCAEGCQHWVPNVTSYFAQLGGDAANLQWSGTAGGTPTSGGNTQPPSTSTNTGTKPATPPAPGTSTATTTAPDITLRVGPPGLPKVSWTGSRKGPITFTVNALISGATPLASSVHLFRVLPQGAQEIATLEDTGTDEGSSQVYSAAASIDDPNAKQLDLQVSATFKRANSKRNFKLVSNTVSVPLPDNHPRWVPLLLLGIGILVVIGTAAGLIVWRIAAQRRKSVTASGAGTTAG